MSFLQRAGRGAANAAVALCSLLLALLALEFGSRWILPLSPGTQFIDVSGSGVDVVAGSGFAGRRGLRPSFTFRQISPDFDALSHTGPLGMRAPEPNGAPVIVFLGDSFTFGQGLTDDQTIPALFCGSLQVSCANLGQPGTGTLRQMDTLEWRLSYHDWWPKDVILLVFAMSSSLMAGNDFEDTLAERAAAHAALGPEATAPSPLAKAPDQGLLRYRQWLRAHSNLVRIVYLWAGPAIRAFLSPPAEAGRLDVGIGAMAEQLKRLRTLSDERGFRITLGVIYPVQDLMRRTHPATLQAVRAAAGGMRVVDTAPALIDDPRANYFPYDGHLNAEGARKVAEVLRGAFVESGVATSPRGAATAP